MKLPDPEPHRVVLGTVDGDSFAAKRRESQLKNTIWRDVRTHRFVNTRDSAWCILDVAILNIDPVKLQYIQDKLDRVCTTLRTRTRFALPNRTRFTLPLGHDSHYRLGHDLH